VDVVGHHAPRQQQVTLRVEVKQCAFDQRGDLRAAQPTFAVAGVEVLFDAPAQFDSALALGFDTGSAGVPPACFLGSADRGSVPARRRRAQAGTSSQNPQLLLPLFEHLLRQGVAEADPRDERASVDPRIKNLGDIAMVHQRQRLPLGFETGGNSLLRISSRICLWQLRIFPHHDH